ncbi:response regulator [bacterium]|nr:response regulator [bacterium]
MEEGGQLPASIPGETEQTGGTGDRLPPAPILSACWAALNATGLGAWDWNIRDNKGWVNEGWLRMLGFPERSRGMGHESWAELLHPDDREMVFQQLQQHLEGKTTTYESEYRLRGADGTYRWILDRGSVVEKDPSGAPIRMAGTQLDITSRVEAEQRFRRLFDSLGDPIIMLYEGRILDCNMATMRVLGVDGKSALLNVEVGTISPVIQPDGRPSGPKFQQMIALAELKGLHRFDWVFRRGNDTQLYSEVTLTTVAANGREEIIAVVRDLSEQRRSTKALQESEARFRAAAEGGLDSFYLLRAVRSSDGIIEDFEFVESNNRGAAMLSRERADLIGQRFSPIFSMILAGDYLHRFVRVVETRIPLEEEYQTDAPGLRGAWLKHQVVAVGDGLAITTRDVTDRKQHEADLIAARDAAEAATRAKSEFLATVSHEIRTPLNGIIGMANLLVDSPLSEEQSDQARTVVQSAEALLSLINDILDLSKVEAGKMEVRNEPFELSLVCEEVIRLLSSRATCKYLELKLHFPDRLPRHVEGDNRRLRQILLNLIGNALKFTDRGEVRLSVDGKADGEDRFVYTFRIKDTGPGIPEGQRHRLFLAFGQLDSTSTRRHGGTGLGLAICRKLVELMGGTIGVESEPGRGSTFWFTLPLALVPEPAAPSTIVAKLTAHRLVMPDGSPPRLLLAEDNMINQRVAKTMLSRLGCEVDVASHGVEAVEKVSRAKYDVILMDCQMPEMDGYDATRAIRALPSSKGTAPIIALTANAMEGDREKCLEAGMNDFLTKPLSDSDLVNSLKRWLPEGSLRPRPITEDR